MAVVIRKIVKIDNQEFELETFQPSGKISKEDRIQAQELDKFLSIEIPNISQKITISLDDEKNQVKKWHLFGKELIRIVNIKDLVKQADVDNLFLWQAVWYFMPDSFKPVQRNIDRSYADKQHKRQDHLTKCYELGKFEWDEISWMRRWGDWHEYTARPAILRDKRILIALGNEIKNIGDYPRKKYICEILKLIAAEFPTKEFRDTSFYTKIEIENIVRDAVNIAIL